MAGSTMRLDPYCKYMALVIFNQIYPNIPAPKDPSITYQNVIDWKIQSMKEDQKIVVKDVIAFFVNNIDKKLAEIKIEDKDKTKEDYQAAMKSGVASAVEQLLAEIKKCNEERVELGKVIFNPVIIAVGKKTITVNMSPANTEEDGSGDSDGSLIGKLKNWLGY